MIGAGWLLGSKFPVNFPVSREFVPETGSLETASTSRESCEISVGNWERHLASGGQIAALAFGVLLSNGAQQSGYQIT